MQRQYEIAERVSGSVHSPASTVFACARACGVTPKKMAEHDAAVLNAEAGDTFYAARRAA